MLLYEWMIFPQAHNPLVNAHIERKLNRCNNDAGSYKDPSAQVQSPDGRLTPAAELSGRAAGDKVRIGFSLHGQWQSETVVLLGENR
jgi:hypothetical protein